MLKSSLSYPYPVLRSESIDYKTSILSIQIDLDTQDTNYFIKVCLNTNNSYINSLLSDERVKKGVIIKSNSVWYKEFFDLTNDNQLTINSKDIYGKVEIMPIIVATKKITNFYSNDFSEEYKSVNISINAGEIIAIGDEYSFDALLESDIFKNTSSIFEFCESDGEQLTYNVDEDKIVINLPKKIKEKYSLLANSISSPKSILNASLVFPVLTSVLYDVKENEDLFEDKKWFKTIMKTIDIKRQKGIMNGLGIDGKIDNPLEVAQSLTNGLLSAALDDIEKIIIDQNVGGD